MPDAPCKNSAEDTKVDKIFMLKLSPMYKSEQVVRASSALACYCSPRQNILFYSGALKHDLIRTPKAHYRSSQSEPITFGSFVLGNEPFGMLGVHLSPCRGAPDHETGKEEPEVFATPQPPHELMLTTG